MNTFRSESLKYCLVFTFIVGVVLTFAGIWSLNASYDADSILVSSLDKAFWIVCGLHIVGFLIAYYLKDRSPFISSWILCITEGSALFVLLTSYYDPHYLFGFIIPILFAIILLEVVQSTVFIGLIVVASVLVSYLHFQNWSFFNQIGLSIFLLLSISLLLEMVLARMNSNLTWYQNMYQRALVNEQIIRENEIKLEMLVDNLKDYKRYLTETNISLIEARDEAEQARTVKQNFVQNVSHELRTPLNLIIGFSETMVNSPHSYGEVNWTSDLHGDIECIYQNSQHLKALIDDILDMASLEAKKYEIEKSDVDLNSLIHEVALIAESAFKTKGLYLETQLSRQVRNVQADAVRIKQVLLNLVSNALKYTNSGGVKISSSIAGSMACVQVSDTGKGIAEEDFDKVFEAFFQVDKSNNRDDFGTGLGLFISKQLIELHGGEMSLTSQLGLGTTVFFSVPLTVKK